MKRTLPIILLVAIMFALLAPAISASASWQVPTFKIDAVVEGETVTITTQNFPANDTFDVLMGKMWTRGINGIKLGTQASGAGGSFTATYDIPDALNDEGRISIRLQSPTSGYYSYNWFWNNTTSGSPPPAGTQIPPVPFVIPTFSIESVVKNTSVTIETKNFPANDSFTVRMGYIGTKGINGIVVGTQDSGAGGTFSATYNVPDALKGQYMIAIRLESPTSGYYAYNWFYNNNAP